MSLLWFENGEVPPRKFRDERGALYEDDQNEDDALLKELDGNLRWASKDRRCSQSESKPAWKARTRRELLG